MKKDFLAKVFLFCIVLCSASAGHASDVHSEPRRIDILAKRFTYAPAEITLKKGEPAILVLKSADVAHGLRCRELNIDVKAGKGATVEARVTPDKVGTFIAHCAVFCGSGHGQMILTIHVVE
jgi:cytochrome c oxidase subunit II